jgi:hypothetical protein
MGHPAGRRGAGGTGWLDGIPRVEEGPRPSSPHAHDHHAAGLAAGVNPCSNHLRKNPPLRGRSAARAGRAAGRRSLALPPTGLPSRPTCRGKSPLQALATQGDAVALGRPTRQRQSTPRPTRQRYRGGHREMFAAKSFPRSARTRPTLPFQRGLFLPVHRHRSVAPRQAEHMLREVAQDKIRRDRRHLVEAGLAEFPLHVVFLGKAEAAMGLDAHVPGLP